MSKGGASAPSGVNANALAQSQYAANLGSANAQSALNNINTTSPYGSSIFNQDANGRWNLSQNLSPQLQALFGNQTSLASLLAGQGTQNVAALAQSPALAGANLINQGYNTWGGQLPTSVVSTEGLAALPTSATDFSNLVNQAQNAAYNTQAGYLDPQFSEKRSDLEQQLADQGLQPGTEAYDRAKGDLGRQETFAYQQAKNAAVQAGNQEQSTLFGENLASRQQGFNERVTQWGEPFQALQSLAGTGEGILSGAANQLATLGSLADYSMSGNIPTYGGSPTSVSPTNFAGIQGAANQANMNRFAAGNTLNNQLFNGLGSLGGALGGTGWLSKLFGSLFGGSGMTGGIDEGTAALSALMGF